VSALRGLSGHADASELLRWTAGLPQPPRRVFLTHGEPEAADALARILAEQKGWATHVPEPGEVADLRA
jgi:metallo-beta-lactamase family protein